MSNAATWNRLIEVCLGDREFSKKFCCDTYDYSVATTFLPYMIPKWIGRASLGKLEPFKQAASIEEISLDLYNRLTHHPWNQYEHVSIVAHSMGGLVTRHSLLQHNLNKRVKHLLLLAVPSQGSHLANLSGRYKRFNEQIDSLGVGNDFLIHLNRNWQAAPPIADNCIRLFYGHRDSIVNKESIRWEGNFSQLFPILGAEHNTIFRRLCEARNFPFFRDFLLEASAQPFVVPSTAEPGKVQPWRLTGDYTPFFGRREEFKRLLHSLKQQRTLIIIGPGGYGKSRLATALGMNLGLELKNGAIRVRLETDRDSDIDSKDDLLRLLSQELSFVPEQIQRSELFGQLAQFLSDKELVIIIDSFERLSSVPASLISLLEKCPGLRLIITSRHDPKFPGVGPHTINEFDAPVELFIASSPGLVLNGEPSLADKKQINRICTAVGNIPLAIRQLASWTDILSLNNIEAQISELLQQDPPIQLGNEPRERNVYESLEWSWKKLSFDMQLDLLRIASFRGGAGMFDAQGILGGSGTAVADRLFSLQDRSWLEYDTALKRFDFINPVLQQFAIEKLGARADFAVVARYSHAKWFSSLSGQLREIPDADRQKWQQEALDRYGEDRGNFIAALEISLEWPELLDQLEEGFLWYLHRISDYETRAQWLDRILEVRRRNPGVRGLGRTLVHRGIAAAMKNNREEALQLYQEGLELALEAEDYWSSARAARFIADTLDELGRPDESLDMYEKSLQYLDLTESTTGQAQDSEIELELARVLNNLGELHYVQGRIELAEQVYDESLRIKEKLQDYRGQAVSFLNLARCAFSRGEVEKVVVLLTKAQGVALEIGDRRTLGEIFEAWVRFQYRKKDFEAMTSNGRKAIDIYHAIGLTDKAEEVSEYLLSPEDNNRL
jgi:tetratricopeptide (TPR) repeat protein/pimeloyl-ACP methyl ester carboxylesterase